MTSTPPEPRANEPAASLPGGGTVRRAALPAWVARLVLVGLLLTSGWMFTGGALSPWMYIFGGLGLLLTLAPALWAALPRMDRLRQSAAGACVALVAGWLVWTALQLAPLPGGLLRVLSPTAAELRQRLGAWDGSSWCCLSLTPEVGRQFLLVWTVGFVVLTTTLLAIRSRDLRLFAQALAVVSGVFALYGLAVFATPAVSEFKPFGVPLLAGRVSGPLVNPNRFAYLLELGLPFCLMLLRDVLRELPWPTQRGGWRLWFHRLLTNRTLLTRLVGWGGLSLLTAVALVLTLSRGGIASMTAALAVGLPVAGWLERRTSTCGGGTPAPAGHRQSARRWNWASLVVLGLVFCFAVGWGFDPLFARVGHLFTEPVDRFEVWVASLPLARDFWLTGVGAGGFRDVFPSYQPADLSGYYRYAHNDYLNTLIDLGLPGALLLLAFLGWWFRGVWLRLTSAHAPGRNWRLAAAIGVLAVSLHSIGDFGLQDPTVLWYCAFVLGLGLCPQTGVGERSTLAAAGVGGAAVGAEGDLPVGVDEPVEGVTRGAGLRWRGRLLQACAVGGLLAGLSLGVLALPQAAADLVRPGTLWVHLDWWRGGVQPSWPAEEVRDWNLQWRRAQEFCPQDSTANYQAALAEYFLLRRELADQPMLAPSVQGPDGGIVLRRTQTALELSVDQRARLAQARAMADRAWQVGPLRPEFHLLRLRLAILADDQAAARVELPPVATLYRGAPRVLPELLMDWLYLYQRNDPTLSAAEFEAQRQQLTQQQLEHPEIFTTAVGLALNRGVSLAQVEAWMPADRRMHLQLAAVLKRLNRLAEAQAEYLAIGEKPEQNEDDRRLRHLAWQEYLEIALRRGQVAEFEAGLKRYYERLDDFEQLDLFKRHLLPWVEFNRELAGDWHRLLLAQTAVSLRQEVAAARFEVLGRLALAQGDWDTAAKELNAARERSADSSILFAVARVAIQQQKYEVAAGCFEDLLQLDSGQTVQVLARLAMCYERSGRIVEAIKTYRRLQQLNPDRKTEYAVTISRLNDIAGEAVAP